MSLSDSLIPVPRCPEGEACTYGGGGGNGRISVGWHSIIRKDHPLVGIHNICPRPCQEVAKRAAFITPAAAEEHIDRSYCHGLSQVSSSLAAHLAVRPLSLSRPTMTSGHPNGKYIGGFIVTSLFTFLLISIRLSP